MILNKKQLALLIVCIFQVILTKSARPSPDNQELIRQIVIDWSRKSTAKKLLPFRQNLSSSEHQIKPIIEANYESKETDRRDWDNQLEYHNNQPVSHHSWPLLMVPRRSFNENDYNHQPDYYLTNTPRSYQENYADNYDNQRNINQYPVFIPIPVSNHDFLFRKLEAGLLLAPLALGLFIPMLLRDLIVPQLFMLLTNFLLFAANLFFRGGFGFSTGTIGATPGRRKRRQIDDDDNFEKRTNEIYKLLMNAIDSLQL